ncbi:hypothetical protein AA14362_1911 [Acetobacter cerevisiae DSM 14362]|nr:hypothetical protein AA14362_1911 [Acetobacter cerevisiae DSM 14362]
MARHSFTTEKGVHGGKQRFPPDQIANHRDTTCPLVCTAGFKVTNFSASDRVGNVTPLNPRQVLAAEKAF